LAAVALLLAAIGLGAGIFAAVSASRREIGIRAALGESRQSLAVRMLPVVPVVMTVTAGLASALPVRRALGISPLEVLRSD
jgi:ABC-type antimicrobial peptide transport system permease subunit